MVPAIESGVLRTSTFIITGSDPGFHSFEGGGGGSDETVTYPRSSISCMWRSGELNTVLSENFWHEKVCFNLCLIKKTLANQPTKRTPLLTHHITFVTAEASNSNGLWNTICEYSLSVNVNRQ